MTNAAPTTICAQFSDTAAPLRRQPRSQTDGQASNQIKLVSTADTGYFYVTKKNPRTKPEKLEVRKYDPKARKHVLFREAKIK